MTLRKDTACISASSARTGTAAMTRLKLSLSEGRYVSKQLSAVCPPAVVCSCLLHHPVNHLRMQHIAVGS